ncbi:MAG: hypothetical protein KAR64_06490, partial [Thermoplasmatales archaeon]|nr:hypothetical protein [Thermoplasmatales archaeon]
NDLIFSPIVNRYMFTLCIGYQNKNIMDKNILSNDKLNRDSNCLFTDILFFISPVGMKKDG